jgi:hypothetical protein
MRSAAAQPNTGPLHRMVDVSRRILGLHGNSIDNARTAVRRDDAARAHRESVAESVAEDVAATHERSHESRRA